MTVRWREMEHRLVCPYKGPDGKMCGVVITGPADRARELMADHRAGHKRRERARRGK